VDDPRSLQGAGEDGAALEASSSVPLCSQASDSAHYGIPPLPILPGLTPPRDPVAVLLLEDIAAVYGKVTTPIGQPLCCGSARPPGTLESEKKRRKCELSVSHLILHSLYAWTKLERVSI
jgi:hypothetical protein